MPGLLKFSPFGHAAIQIDLSSTIRYLGFKLSNLLLHPISRILGQRFLLQNTEYTSFDSNVRRVNTTSGKETKISAHGVSTQLLYSLNDSMTSKDSKDLEF